MLRGLESAFTTWHLVVGLTVTIVGWLATIWVRRGWLKRLLRAAAIATAWCPSIAVVHSGFRLAPAWAVGQYYLSGRKPLPWVHTGVLSALPIFVATLVIWGLYSIAVTVWSEGDNVPADGGGSDSLSG